MSPSVSGPGSQYTFPREAASMIGGIPPSSGAEPSNAAARSGLREDLERALDHDVRPVLGDEVRGAVDVLHLESSTYSSKPWRKR
jgi:hypothetical protein